MFSRVDIKKAISRGVLKISPYNEKNLQPNSYRLHLDSDIAIAKKGTVVRKTSNYSKYYTKKKVKEFVLRPGMFVLARSKERISLGKEISAFVNGRTTLARLGIAVTQTAPVIQSGHGKPKSRKIVFEISNVGPLSVTLYEGMAISEMVIFGLHTPTDKLYDETGIYGKKKDLDDLLPLKDI